LVSLDAIRHFRIAGLGGGDEYALGAQPLRQRQRIPAFPTAGAAGDQNFQRGVCSV
jgi:hypothetical protein